MADKSRKTSLSKKSSFRSGSLRKSKDAKSMEDSDRENSFVYKVLTEANTKALLELDVDDVQRKMVEVLEFPNHETDLLEASQLDYFVGAFWWAKEQGFSPALVSSFFTAAHVLLTNIKDKNMHILDNIQEFKEMLRGIGSMECETPGGLDCFDKNQAQAIAEFFHKTLFQHHKLYVFIFSHTQAEEVIGLDLNCELVMPADTPWPPPLDEGLPIDVWEKYVKTPPPTPAPPTEEDAQGAADRLQQEARAAKALQEAEAQQENELLAQMSAEEIQQVVTIVTTDMFKHLNSEMAAKLRERENTILNRINKVHKVA